MGTRAVTKGFVVRRLAVAVALLALVGCASRSPLLYSWESFPRLQYDILLREGASPLAQIAAMNAHAESAKAKNVALPPGFRAHLGMLHLSVGNADAARDLWSAEKVAFPESAHYMNSLLRRLDGSSKAATKDNPA
jgi:hypothetical protein